MSIGDVTDIFGIPGSDGSGGRGTRGEGLVVGMTSEILILTISNCRCKRKFSKCQVHDDFIVCTSSVNSS